MKLRVGAAIGIADQGASALSNFLLMIAVARADTPQDFGSFTICVMLYSALLTVSRSLLSEPYTVISNTTGQWLPRVVCLRLIGTAAALGCLGGIVGLLVFPLIGVLHGANTLIVLVGLPALLVQDLARWFAIAAGRQLWALIADVLWVLVMASWLAPRYVGWRIALPPALIWIVGSLLGTVILVVLFLRRSPTLTGQEEAASFSRVLQLGAPAAGETFVGAFGLQLGFYLAVAIVGADAVGAARGALLVLGPLSILTSGLLQFLLPRMSRTPITVRSTVLRTQLWLIGLLALAAIPFYSLPPQIGEGLLGASWPTARAALPPMVVYTAFILCFIVAQSGIRARRASSRLFMLRRVDAVLIPLTFVIGAVISRDAFFWAVALTGAFDLIMVTIALRLPEPRTREAIDTRRRME